jgi:hypothetical protein
MSKATVSVVLVLPRIRGRLPLTRPLEDPPFIAAAMAFSSLS